MAARLHVGIDPKADRRAPPLRFGHPSQHPRFLDAFKVELEEAARQRLGHLRVGLADARKDDPVRRDARRTRAAIFTDGDHVRAKPRRPKHPKHRRIGVGLDRISDQRLA